MCQSLLGTHFLQVVEHFCARCESDLGLQVLTAIAFEDWDYVVSCDRDPRKDDTPHGYQCDRDLVALFKKLDGLPTSFDKEAEALKNWWNSEQACYRTNERFAILDSVHSNVADQATLRFFLDVRKKIASVLRRAPDHLSGRFGPGATYSDPSMASTVLDKVSSCPSFTPEAWPFLIGWSGTAWARACADLDRKPTSVRGNRFATVPKDSKKNRCIGVEPSVNLFYQLSVGRALRKRMRYSTGLDLDNGAAYHREMARESSRTGRLATIDLSNASDTLSLELVKFLLPTDWVDLLDSLRSPMTLLGGKWVKLEKFSSMGNGFTFELETLIFWGIAAVAMEWHGLTPEPYKSIAVYGDDILIPTEAAQTAIAALRYAGFSTNTSKTFVDGSFRESCGGDYLNGFEVRPHFVKELPYEPQHWIVLANGIRRLASRNSGSFDGDPSLYRAWRSCLAALPLNVRRCRGPLGLGDLLIHDQQDRWTTRTRYGIRYLRVYRPVVQQGVSLDGFAPSALMAGALYGMKSTILRSGHRNGENGRWGLTPRNPLISYKEGWVAWS